MIIFNLGQKRTVISVALDDRYCVRCHNDVKHRIVFTRSCLKLYFVITLLTFDKQWAIECPICSHTDAISKQAANSDCPFNLSMETA